MENIKTKTLKKLDDNLQSQLENNIKKLLLNYLFI